MAKKAWLERNKRKAETVKKYAALRAELKKKKDYAALQKLYPAYLPNPGLLAGISGNIEATIATVQTNGSLGSDECSWIYLRGLKSSDAPDTILIYERRAGVYVNGVRKKGRAVGFVDGSAHQMNEETFQKTIREQELSRRFQIGIGKE